MADFGCTRELDAGVPMKWDLDETCETHMAGLCHGAACHWIQKQRNRAISAGQHE